MVADPLTWTTAVTVIGGALVAIATVFGVTKPLFKKRTPWVAPMEQLAATTIRLEAGLNAVDAKIVDIQSLSANQEARHVKDFDRIHDKLEKITDLMIDMLRDDGSSNDKS
jgi:hypothetical protein